jgi:cytochrome d ubiquinol oxidase subunit II
VAVGAIVAGWPLAQSPEFLPGLTLEEATAPDATLVALAIAIGAGLIVLVPSLALLYRLVLSGAFDDPRPSLGEATAAEIRSRRPPPAALFLALAVAGCALTFLTEGGAGRVIGLVCMFAALVAGAAVALAPNRVGALADGDGD